MVPGGHHCYVPILQNGACCDVEVAHCIITDPPQNMMDRIIVKFNYYEVYAPPSSWRDLFEILDYGRPNVSLTSAEAEQSVWVIADRATWIHHHVTLMVHSGLVDRKQRPKRQSTR